MTAFRFIEAEKANHTIRTTCRVLQVSRAGYYDWKARTPAANGERALVVHIRSIHRESHGTYGSPRVARALRGRGLVTNRKRVARLMQQEGLGLPRGPDRPVQPRGRRLGHRRRR